MMVDLCVYVEWGSNCTRGQSSTSVLGSGSARWLMLGIRPSFI